VDAHAVVLALHVAAGVLGLVLGAVVIWLSRDAPVLDGRSVTYHWTVLAVCLTAIGLSLLDLAGLWWLIPVAAFAYALALLGYLAPRRRFTGWQAAYAHGQGGSYIALVTALLVVALTVDGPLKGAASALPWALPVVVGTLLIERWRRRLGAHGRHA
jgi:uncharacterized membrane protein